jgi:hypothetical protein
MTALILMGPEVFARNDVEFSAAGTGKKMIKAQYKKERCKMFIGDFLFSSDLGSKRNRNRE